jgi:diaminohydroxyphosphoribosylaminopyrimidine deaminase/5-amino-6-(5-phosphoribosylamino)uracil reductase
MQVAPYDAPTMAVVTEHDLGHLRRALELAEGGRGHVSPNPLVGAVIARNGEVLGEGFHAELGGEHAEISAIEDARRRGEDPRGATMYVTLEPCAHHGRRPPCAPAVGAAGIARVVIGCDDPSEKASGRGPGILRDEGVEVEFAEGAEAAAARLLVQPFRKHARTGLPLVTHKAAVSLDGRTATAAGDARWISGPQSRELVHRWRADCDAVAVGIGTALADDPLLTARDVGAARQPRRVVFDSRARLPLDSQLVASVDEAPLIVICGSEAPTDRVAALREAGAELIAVPGERAEVGPALAELGRREVCALLLEGGATLAAAFYAAGEIDRLRLFIAPLIVGGEAPPLLRGEGTARIAEASRPLAAEWERSGDDMLVSARLREW